MFVYTYLLLYGTVWHCMVGYTMVWYGVVGYGMLWRYGKVWYGKVWYAIHACIHAYI